MITQKILDKILKKVQKPARYTGGEVNVSDKVFSDHLLNFCICFPDLYDVGMSNLGIKILQGILNNSNFAICERAFTPWIDMITEMKSENVSLFSIESKTELNKFDVLGFSLQSELCFTNMLEMLFLSKIPFRDRDESQPIIIAGGPCAYNFEPIAPFVEDIGMADSNALLISISALTSCENLGMPECELTIAHAIIYLCEAEKSNSVYLAKSKAKEFVVKYKDLIVPNMLKNHKSDINDKTGTYKYPHDFGGYVAQTYLPEEIKNEIFYVPSKNGREANLTRKKDKFNK